jgi:hypothetical protein
MAGMIITHKIGKDIGSVSKAAQQSQDNLNAMAQSSHVEHSSPGGESTPAKPIAHDDAVDHALMTDPSTGGPHKDFPNSVSSILDKLRRGGGSFPNSVSSILDKLRRGGGSAPGGGDAGGGVEAPQQGMGGAVGQNGSGGIPMVGGMPGGN